MDHFDGGALDPRWVTLTSSGGTVGVADSCAELASPAGSDAAAFYYHLKLDKTRSQLWVFAISNHSGEVPQWWVTLINSAAAPLAESLASLVPRLRARVAMSSSGVSNTIQFNYWDTTHARRLWNGSAWSTSGFALAPARADDYYLVGLELDGPSARWRLMVWGRRSGSPGGYTPDQGLKLFALTDWVPWANLEATDDLWLVVGDQLLNGLSGQMRVEWVRHSDGARRDVWVNSSSGGAYRIRHWYGYEGANGAVEQFVPQDRATLAVDVGPSGAWDGSSAGVKDQYAVRDGGTYYLYYNSGSGGIGLASATHPDGPWTKEAGNPLLQGIPGGEEQLVFNAAVVKDLREPDPSMSWKMIYTGFGADNKHRLFYATAPAAQGPWQRQGKVLDVGGVGAPDEFGVTRARPVWSNGQWYVFFTVRNATPGVWNVSYATGSRLDSLAKSAALLAPKRTHGRQNVTADVAGRVVNVADTSALLPEASVLLRKSASQTNDFAVSRIRRILGPTSVELYHGLDGFLASAPGELLQDDSDAMRLAGADLVQAGGSWWLYVTDFSGGRESTGLLRAPSLTGPYEWVYESTPPVTLALWDAGKSNENITFVHDPVDTGPPAPDTTPPAISGVIATNITESGATVEWTTDEASDSRVEYGTTDAYGSMSPLYPNLTTTHLVALSGLLADTEYHYRVISSDLTGNQATSGDLTFSTAPANVLPMAAFTYSCVDLMCDFDGSGSSDSDGMIVGYAWNYGDGNTASGVATSHSFAAGGTYQVTLTVTDNRGAVGAALQSLTVAGPPPPPPDMAPPTVSVSAPTDGETVTGSVTVTALATDNVGVEGVQLLVDGNNLGSEIATGPYSSVWDTTTVLNGPHQLSARARDAAGNMTTSDAVSVIVDNNYALDFDGADDAVVVPGQVPPAQFSFSAWIFPRSLGERSAGHLFTIRDDADNNPTVTLRLAGNAQLRFIVAFDNAGATSVGAWDTPPASIALNTLQHVALSYDASSAANAPTFYVDGVAQPLVTVRAPVGMMRTEPASLVVGNNPGGDGTFDGIIDEVRIYSRLLTAAEVQIHYNNGQMVRLGDEPGMQGLWHFDEGRGTVGMDSSGNLQHASLLFGPLWVLH